MNTEKGDEVSILRLTLHDRLVGHLAGFRSGRNTLRFADEYAGDPGRPTFSLITHPAFPQAGKSLSEPWTRNVKLHPVLSNLLPEGALRELIARGLKVHIDSEFNIFAWLGGDLPGALIAAPLAPDEVPDSVLPARRGVNAVKFREGIEENRFSLAGVQMKFSMKEKDKRYTLSKGDVLGDWIIKTPFTRYRNAPLNEYVAMSLASMAGIDTPEVRLVDPDSLDNLPRINLPNEKQAFAIRRFDRRGADRVHMEDFAQATATYPHDKYGSASYEQIGRVLYRYSGDGLADACQFARRLLVNILLANGDAHLKNWSLLYQDKITPRLSPAYDILTTSVYIEGEREFALNLAGTKKWHAATMDHFRHWAGKAGVPWRAVRPHLDDVMDKARTLWPAALKTLPADDAHEKTLLRHWSMLPRDFRIETT